MTSRASTVILGGGLAGLSAAYHLKGDFMLFERDKYIGGTARSFKIDGFTFDFTGHLLHLHNDYTRDLITRLLKNNFYRCRRSAWIFSHDTYTRYPFQANTFGLPRDVIDECVAGYVEAYLDNKRKKKEFSRMDFQDWCLNVFGTGISKHFMLPYNEKLYQVPAKEMTVDWCGSFVPQPKIEEVVKGALADQKTSFGYNTEFLYPKSGGIQALAEALAEGLPNIRLKTEIASVNWRERVVELADGEQVSYSQLVNTIPLAEFLKRCVSLPAEVERAAQSLRAVGIMCLNIGVKRSRISDKSWIYFPEGKYPFYRVGFPMNFTPHVVPRGCSSMYVEVPLKLSENLSEKELLNRVRKGLIEAKILEKSDKLPVVQFLPIRYAYVIYDRNRRQSLDVIFKFLSENRIQSIGRYGAWKYSFMEEAILDGKKAAEQINASVSV